MPSKPASDQPKAPLSLSLTALAVILFLHCPFIIILLYAFTTDERAFTFPPPGLTLEWFGVTWNRPDVWRALALSVQVALVCVWRLVKMVRRGTVFSDAAFRYVDVMIGAIVAAALVWFAITLINAPGQRDDPGVTLIMGGIGLGILGVALIVLVLRMLLAQAVARDVEATQLRAELDEVI